MKTIYILDNIGRLGAQFTHSIKVGATVMGFETRTISSRHNLPKINTGDILVMWNRHFAEQDYIARLFENVNNKVFVFERTYFKNMQDNKEWYALGHSLHNDLRYSPTSTTSPDRFESFTNIKIQPWKKRTDNNILVISQSKRYDGCGFGYMDYAHPVGWDSQMCVYIKKKIPNANIILRQNPKTVRNNGRNKYMPSCISHVSYGETTLEEDLDKYDVRFCAAYTSGGITDSLLHGVPVFIDQRSSGHIFKDVCSGDILNIQYPDTRQAICEKIAWCQYSDTEIENGEIFLDNYV